MSARSLNKINAGIVSSCIIGMALSYYAYNVETKKEHDASYEAMCDINEWVSCTTVFMSKWAKGFGIIPEDSILYLPNSIYGLVFYTVIALLGTRDAYLSTVGLIVLGILSNLSSIYLARILYILQDICIVCVSVYIVNAVILILAFQKYGIISGKSKKKQKKN